MWCSLEALGRNQQMVKLYGLKEARKKDKGFWRMEGLRPVYYSNHAGYPLTVRMKLNELKVKFQMQEPGNKGLDIIKNAFANGRACAIGVNSYVGPHAVVLTELTNAKAIVVCPNTVGYKTVMTRAEFDGIWDGFVVVIEESGVVSGAQNR